MKYPEELAPRGNKVDEYLSGDGQTKVKVSDPYRFFEDTNSIQTKKWVKAEQQLTQKFFKSCGYIDKIKSTMKKNVNFPKIGKFDK